MTGLESSSVLFVNGSLSVLLTALVLGILWNVRDVAVGLWVAGGLIGAAFSFSLAGDWGAEIYRTRLGQWFIGSLAIASALLRLLAVGRLGYSTESEQPERWRLPGLVLIAGMLPVALLMPSSIWISGYFIVIVSLLTFAFSLRVFRIGRFLSLPNAKVFAVIISLQVSIVMLGWIAGAVTGVDAIEPTQEPVSLAGMLAPVALMIINNGLFVSLVLDINLRRTEDISRQLQAVEVERSRSDERARLLADMHDGFGAHLTTARIKLERGGLNQFEMLEVVNECMTDMHLMVDTLRESGDCLASALADYRYRTERRLADRHLTLAWSFELDEAPALSPRALLQAMRVVQEAVNNALKHSQAGMLRITARYAPQSGFELSVIDDGIGIDEPVDGGRGCANMRRRARELGGSLHIGRRPVGAGTVVSLQFPPDAEAGRTTAETPLRPA
jgi:signal transduction histidine kinase